MGKISETNSGLKCRGSWKDICKVNDEVEKEIEKSPKFKEDEVMFKCWKPRIDENFSKLKDKTAKLMSSDKKIINKIEYNIFNNIMMKFNPIYFDMEYMSLNLDKRQNGYVLNIHIQDNGIRKGLKNRLNT